MLLKMLSLSPCDQNTRRSASISIISMFCRLRTMRLMPPVATTAFSPVDSVKLCHSNGLAVRGPTVTMRGGPCGACRGTSAAPGVPGRDGKGTVPGGTGSNVGDELLEGGGVMRPGPGGGPSGVPEAEGGGGSAKFGGPGVGALGPGGSGGGAGPGG